MIDDECPRLDQPWTMKNTSHRQTLFFRTSQPAGACDMRARMCFECADTRTTNVVNRILFVRVKSVELGKPDPT
jgi:hypothetical protein